MADAARTVGVEEGLLHFVPHHDGARVIELHREGFVGAVERIEQREGHRLGVVEALVTIAGQRLDDHVPELLGQQRDPHRPRRFEDRDEGRRRGRPAVRRPAREHLVEQRAHGVEVGPRIEPRAPANLLRGHIRGGAEERAFDGLELPIGDLREAEVHELRDHVAVRIDDEEHVARREVAVDDGELVGMPQGREDRQDEGDGLPRPERCTTLEIAADRLAGEELHDEHDGAALVLDQVVDLDDVAVRQHPADACFLAEARNGLFVRRAGIRRGAAA